MTRRTEQVASQIQRTAAEALVSERLEGPQLLTVTRAQVSPDLRQASLWVAGWAQLTPARQAYLERVLARAVRDQATSKFTPRLAVLDDSSSAYAQHIAELLADQPKD